MKLFIRERTKLERFRAWLATKLVRLAQFIYPDSEDVRAFLTQAVMEETVRAFFAQLVIEVMKEEEKREDS